MIFLLDLPINPSVYDGRSSEGRGQARLLREDMSSSHSEKTGT